MTCAKTEPSLATAAAQQFDAMTQTSTLVAHALAENPPDQWLQGQSLWVIAMGAASATGQVLAEALRDRGVAAVNLEAAAASRHAQAGLMADHYLLISQSGRSPETVNAARHLPKDRRLVVTGDPASPLAGLATWLVPLAPMVDSAVYMMGNTCTLVALAALARAAGHDFGEGETMVDLARRAYQQNQDQAKMAAQRLATLTSVDVVGQGQSFGAAQAAGLLWREAGALPTAVFTTRQYLHGPMEALRPGGGVVLFGGQREAELASQVQAAGQVAIQIVVGSDGSQLSGGSGQVVHFDHPATGLNRMAVQVVLSQLIAIELAKLRGVAPGQWRFPQPDTKLSES
ncbi:MAG: hypothetical protein FWG16_01930 [Micrococcales bacterium]|nr:hypothetical protein [Micrococcales bacterium]